MATASKEIDEGFLIELGIQPGADAAEKLYILRYNGVKNVKVLCAFSSKEDLQSLKAKKDKGEEVAMRAGTVAVLWQFIQERRRKGKFFLKESSENVSLGLTL